MFFRKKPEVSTYTTSKNEHAVSVSDYFPLSIEVYVDTSVMSEAERFFTGVSTGPYDMGDIIIALKRLQSEGFHIEYNSREGSFAIVPLIRWKPSLRYSPLVIPSSMQIEKAHALIMKYVDLTFYSITSSENSVLN